MGTSATPLEKMRRHIEYEMGMLEETQKLLANPPPGLYNQLDAKQREVVKNAILESFLTHARSLIEFLFYGGSDPGDISAWSYDQLWGKTRSMTLGKQPPVLLTYYPLMQKHFAHITLDRVPDDDGETGQVAWPFNAIVAGIRPTYDLFQQTAGWT